MRTLYLECAMGAAGDMLAAALLDLLDADSRGSFIKEVNALGLPGVAVSAETAESCGIHGLHWEVEVSGEREVSEDTEPGARRHDHHDHDRHHDHDHHDHDHHDHDHHDHNHHDHDHHDHDHHDHDHHDHDHHDHDHHDHDH
ncbi:MAG: DUF111 family protein, partial [Oscillospiraceae bacterium]|nr:DUF111 family protein [Oscillospiraceae bacterium]